MRLIGTLMFTENKKGKFLLYTFEKRRKKIKKIKKKHEDNDVENLNGNRNG